MAKKDEIKPQLPEAAQQAQIPEVYTNTALVNFSPYEFEVTFGLGSSNYEGVRPVVNLRLSPQFAREFARIITENVRRYEENIERLIVPEAAGKR